MTTNAGARVKELINHCNRIISQRDPMRRSAAVLLTAFIQRDHEDFLLAAQCAKYLRIEYRGERGRHENHTV